MDHLYSAFVYAFASLFAMVNPIGMSAVFLAMTKDLTADQRHKMAIKVAIYGTILLIASFYIGPYLLRFFGISLPCIQVAGGMLVFFSAWNMLNSKPQAKSDHEPTEDADITFFPLTMPITAGAGSIAITIALAARLMNHGSYDLLGSISTILAIIAVFIIVAFCYRFSDKIFNKLGPSGTNVMTRLTAFLLLAIGVSVIWEGIIGLISPLLNK